jgi:hypothetical protein
LLASGCVIGIIAALQTTTHILRMHTGLFANHLLGYLLILGVCGVYAAYVHLIEIRPVSEIAGQLRRLNSDSGF